MLSRERGRGNRTEVEKKRQSWPAATPGGEVSPEGLSCGMSKGEEGCHCSNNLQAWAAGSQQGTERGGVGAKSG
eukprot:3097843-Rhodomonas_salina.1